MFKQMTKTTIILIIFTTAALGFGLWGWMVDMGYGFNDAFFRTVSVFFMSDTYQDLVKNNRGLSLNIARWCGFFVLILGASKAITLLLSKQLEEWRAKRLKDHLMFIGDDIFAYSLVHAALDDNRKVTWLAASITNQKLKTKNLFVRDGKWNINEACRYGLAKAKSVTIVVQDDASAIAIARQIRDKFPDETKLTVHVFISAPWLAMRFDDIKGVVGIRLISVAQTTIRQTHRKHPPFLIAKKYDHKCIHSVIVGFGRFGEAVLLDTILSSLTTYLKKPRFTIIDPNANAIKNNLQIRYPELHLTAEIDFIERSIEGTAHSLNEEELVQIGKVAPVTVCYICLSDEATSLSSGIALQTLMVRNGWNTGPIFIRLSTGGTLPKTDIGALHLEDAQLLSFGNVKSLVKDTGILSDDADGLAKTYHKAYEEASSEGKVAKVPWEKLSEDKRDSNRRVVTHIAAKLSSAGIDIEPWLKSWHKKPDQAHLPHAEGILNNDELSNKLAILEHERWMADRYINGWCYGNKRDDLKRIHPDLIPFDQLSKESQDYDRLMVRTLAEILEKQS